MAATAAAAAAAAATVAAFFSPLPCPKAVSLSSSWISTVFVVKSQVSICAPSVFLNPRSFPLLPPCPLTATKQARRGGVCLCTAVQDISVEEQKEEEEEEEEQETEGKRRKLYVVNLPWDFTAPDMKKLFSQCGTVKDVEIIKQKNGKSRGFAFVTMASGEEARAAVEKLDSYELTGRIIRVEFAKSFRKPAPPPPPGAVSREPHHKVFVTNLAWKARSGNLKEFFSEKFKPLSARVVFENPRGRSTGYGFVGFATKEEAEAAVSEMDGKELMGRPVRLRISHKTEGKSESESEPGDTDGTDEQSDET